MGTRRGSRTLKPDHATQLKELFPLGAGRGVLLCARLGQALPRALSKPSSSYSQEEIFLSLCQRPHARDAWRKKEEGVETAPSFRGKHVRVPVKSFRAGPFPSVTLLCNSCMTPGKSMQNGLSLLPCRMEAERPA